MTPITRIREVAYVRWRVECPNAIICDGAVEFDWRAADSEPPEKHRRRYCERCRKMRAKAKAAATRAKNKAKLGAAYEAGKLSKGREHAREERKRRARWRTVPSSLRTNKDSNDGK